MSYDESYTADIQAIAVVHSAGMTGAARNAEASLKRLHRDLPEMANFTIKYLGESGIDVGASKATSHRLTEALMRETAIRPQEKLSNYEKLAISDAAMRTVLVQEAAAHEYEARTGKMDTYRQFMGDRSTSNGETSMGWLEGHKIDTVALYGQASDAELTQMSVGAFNRMGRAQQERTAKVLDTLVMTAPAPAVAEEIKVAQHRPGPPVRGSITRHPHGDVRRAAPVFGRRMTPALAVAGQGI